MSTTNWIDARTLREQLLGEEELALLDVREELTFGAEHLLYASCMPLSRLELLAPAMLRRSNVPIVLCDGGEGLAERARARLNHFGYDNVRVLEGGTVAWRDAGFELFSGVNVPSKSFGEFIEHEYDTPSLSADELRAKLDAGEDVVILDSRPMTEYHARSIPTGVCVPGAELAYRVHDLVSSPDTQVVVNCAGRTRSIIGAQSLINAGLPNSVHALRNGTMGWHLAGHALDTGEARTYGDVSEPGLAAAAVAARRVAEQFGVRRIGRDTLRRWEQERASRSLYVLDVRSPEEYVAGHLPGSRSAPGGQLVQETDRYLPTLRSRVVLVDGDGVRATMTASWLAQMGWSEVTVLDDAFEGETLEPGPGPREVLGLDDVDAEEVSPGELHGLLDADSAEVIDLSRSRSYRAGHVPGAAFAIRARLDESLSTISGSGDDGTVVLVSEAGDLARLAAPEVALITSRPVKVLAGGMQGWTDAGLPTTQGPEHLIDDPDDIWLRPYDKDWGVEQAMQDYLTWEVALAEKIERDATAHFRGRDG